MSIRPTIAAIVIAKNEAANLERCLQSLTWCDERIVVDDSSTDGSQDVAARCGARVVSHRFESFARQRNWAITDAGVTHDWCLMLDADEVSTEEFASAIRKAIEAADAETVAYRTCRKTMFLGRWLKRSDGFPVWIMRIVRRNRPLFQDAGHGEIPVPNIEGRIGTIQEPFLHYAFSKGLSDWLDRHNRYSSREAAWEASNSSRPSLRNVVAGEKAIRRKALRDLGRRTPLRPLMRFFYQYGFKLGFLDGRPGFVFCGLMAYYEWLILLKRRELELQRDGVEL